MANMFNYGNPVFASFAFHGTVCTAKMMYMGVHTTLKRLTNNVYATPEDIKAFGGEKPTFDNEAVERVRRNHLNDMENIVPFVLVGFYYVGCDPSEAAAILHFRLFTAARLFHTIAYQVPLPQPCRFLAHVTSVGVIVSMMWQVFKHVWQLSEL